MQFHIQNNNCNCEQIEFLQLCWNISLGGNSYNSNVLGWLGTIGSECVDDDNPKEVDVYNVLMRKDYAYAKMNYLS